MMNDEFKNEMPTSQEFYADQAPADWANEPEPEQEVPVGELPSVRPVTNNLPSYDEVADTFAADAWHDAHEYPEW